MTAVNENLILSELKKIVDPSQQKDIVSLGYIASINIETIYIESIYKSM